MRSEALKQAQMRYRLKCKNNPLLLERIKLSQKKYREKNYERCLVINRNSMKRNYQENESIKENKKMYYLLNRNYRNIENTIGKSISNLFLEC